MGMDGGGGHALKAPSGVVLNAVELHCTGKHQVTRLSAPTDRAARAVLESRVGSSVFVQGAYAYKGGTHDLPDSERWEVACDSNRPLHLFDVRDALAAHVSSLGYRSWFGFGGILHVAGLPGAQTVDGVLVDRRLRLRIVDDGVDGAVTSLVGRADTRWLVSDLLQDPIRASRCLGESVERLTGDGPRRGRVLSVDGPTFAVAAGPNVSVVPTSDYVIAANSRFVVQEFGPSTLRRLQVASGSLSTSGQRNRYAVKDRYSALARGLNAIGGEFELLGGGTVVMSDELAMIRLQDAP